MSRNVNLEKWRGKRAEVELDPEAIQFVPKTAPKTCKGCLFDDQWARVCDKAIQVALRADMPSCSTDGVIYVRKEIDQRQQTIPCGENDEL